ncbi:hypothetical protein BGW38_009243, partial [Lunasporangiospora selenospora]
PFLVAAYAHSAKLICEHGLTKYAGHALVCFGLGYSSWYNHLDNAYEVGKLACKVSGENSDVIYLFNLSVQQYGEHVANCIMAMEKELASTDLAYNRAFHTGRLIHVVAAHFVMGRVHLRDCISSMIDLVNKHNKLDPMAYKFQLIRNLLQLIRILKGRKNPTSHEAIPDIKLFLDLEPPKTNPDGSPEEFVNIDLTLKVIGAFIYGQYDRISEITNSWHDDPISVINFECSWVTHVALTVVGLSLATLLRTEKDPEVRARMRRQLIGIRAKME